MTELIEVVVAAWPTVSVCSAAVRVAAASVAVNFGEPALLSL